MNSNDIDFEHGEMVKELCKPGSEIVKDLTPSAAHLLHMAVGVSGEAGELLDAVKKYAIYAKDIDMQNIIEELGDIEFFLSGIRSSLALSRAWILAENIRKLRTRYPQGYTNKAAQERKDKCQKPT
jgi:NTP pyrophosphatase (non-canonical NTP hydrolase)